MKKCLQNNKIILRSQQRFKNKKHNVFNKKVNKIASSFNDNKILQPYKKVKRYPYEASAETEKENIKDALNKLIRE